MGVKPGPDGQLRCWWCLGGPEYIEYHDREWGRPSHDEAHLFEMLTLEAFQSGLSWLTILRKRDSFRRAFDHWDVDRIASYGEPEVERLLGDASIVRNRAKIEATVNNARRCVELRDEFGSFAAYVWGFEPDPGSRPPVLDHAALMALSQSRESKAMSKDLRRRGWAFVGPTTAYAFMQAMGLVNDHLDGCDSRPAVEAERATFQRPG
jgi:DNA-3-methyladenine glycosylase I